MNLDSRQIPVFAFPNCLKFFLGTKSTHTQILTLYSPYDFPVRFKVHCHSNAWDKYTVTNPEGSIAPQSTVDLVVTHKQPIPANCNSIDKFKVLILDHETEQVIGKKYIESILLAGEKDSRMQDEDFEFHHSSRESTRTTQSTPPRVRSQDPTPPPPNTYIVSVVVAICAAILFLPTEPELTRTSNLPSYLHVSHKIQLLAALLLGVFLCILIRN